MDRPPSRAAARSARPTHRLFSIGVALIATFIAQSAPADTFKLKSGNTIEGDIEKDLGDKLLVRVAIGVIEIDKQDIVSRTEGLTPWKRYDIEKAKHPNTAEGHVALAQWCHDNGLRDREMDHYRKALALDADNEAAHLGLGHVKTKTGWIDPKEQAKADARAAAKDDPDRAEKKQQQQADKLLREIVTKWHVRIKSIYRERMEGKDDDTTSPKFAEGRKQILAIQDPLAIPALSGVLSRGKPNTRRVMVEALGRFAQDEATMNLLVVAMLDPNLDIRRRAAIELIPRTDDRIVDRLRDALAIPDERSLRNAAVALGIVKARKAVPDLIDVLSREARVKVQVTRPVWVERIRNSFGGATNVSVNNRNYRYRPGEIGVLNPDVYLATETTEEIQVISILRTEVQEALIAITGQNFGFDADAWRQWWNHQDK